MKTRELIRRLNEADPSGEIECCADDRDIHFVSVDPAYWDGTLQVLIRDPAKEPYYNIVGAKYVSGGHKLSIRTLSITDAICNNPDLPIEYNEYTEKYRDGDDKTRAAWRDVQQDSELRLFRDWAKSKAAEVHSKPNNIVDAAEEFFRANKDNVGGLNRNTPIPADISGALHYDSNGNQYYDSYANSRKKQWSREISVEFDGFDWVISYLNQANHAKP